MAKNWWEESALESAAPKNESADEWWSGAKLENAPQRTWGEAIKDTGAQLAEGVNTTLGAIPSVVAPQSKATGFFRDNAEHWRDKQSDVLKGRIAETDKRIQEAGKDGVMSQIGTAASEYWNDPAQAARLVATNLPSMAATLGTGAAAGFAAKGVAAARGLDAANKAALAAKYGTTTAAVTNAALNAGGARGEAFEDLQKSALAQGMTPEQAEQAGVSGSILPGVVGGVAGAISGKIGLEKALLGQATTGAFMRKAGGAFGAELAGEQIEELAPKVATNYQVGQLDAARGLTDDLGRTMVETAIGAGPGAVVAGGAAGMRTGELPPSPGAGDPTTSPGAGGAPYQPAPSLTGTSGAELLQRQIDARNLDPLQAALRPVAGPSLTGLDGSDLLQAQMDAARQNPLLDAMRQDPVRQQLEVATSQGGALSPAALTAIDSGASSAMQPVAPDAAPPAPISLEEADARDQAAYEQFFANLDAEPVVGRYVENDNDIPDFDAASNVSDEDFLRSLGATDEDIQDAIATSRQPTISQSSPAVDAGPQAYEPAGPRQGAGTDQAAQGQVDVGAIQQDAPASPVPAVGGRVGDDGARGATTVVPDASGIVRTGPGPDAANGAGAAEPGAARPGGRGDGNPELSAPTNLRDALVRVRAQKQEAANAQTAAQPTPTKAPAVSTARPGAVEAAGLNRPKSTRKAAEFDARKAAEIEAGALGAQEAEAAGVPTQVTWPAHRKWVYSQAPRMTLREFQVALKGRHGMSGPEIEAYYKSSNGGAEVSAAKITTEGTANVPQADQAQQTATQPTQAGAAQPTQGLTDAAADQNTGAQGQAAPGAQGAAQAESAEQRTQRVAKAGEAWTRMPTAQREALAGIAAGLNPIQRKRVPSAAWADLNRTIQRNLADAMGTRSEFGGNQAGTSVNTAPVAINSEADQIAEAVSKADRLDLKGADRAQWVHESLSAVWGMTPDEVRDVPAVAAQLRKKPSAEDATAASIRAVEQVVRQANQPAALTQQEQAATENVANDSAGQDDKAIRYELPPEKYAQQQGDESWMAAQSPSFKPTARQQLLMDAVAKALDDGAFYNSDVDEHVAKALGVTLEQRARNSRGVEGGDFGYDVYNASRAVEAQRSNAKSREFAKALNLKPGDVLGTLVFNDGKVTTGVKVNGLNDSGLVVTVTGKRGAATLNGEVGIDGLAAAMDRAKERGKRKDGYAEFVAGRGAVQPSPQDFITDPASASPESESSQGSSNARGQDASAPPTTPEVKADDVEPKIMQSRPNDWPYANYGWVMVGGGRNAPGAASEKGAKIELSKNPEWKERGAVILPFRWNDGGLRGLSPYAETTTRYAILVRQKESPRIEASSETPPPPAAQPITRAEVTAAQQQAAPKKKPSADQTRAKTDALTEREKAAKAKMLGALGKLAALASKNTRMNWTPEEEQKLLPIVIELFDGAIELGAVTFQKAVAYVRDFIAQGIDQETADAIPFETLQGAYIAVAGRHKDKGVTAKKEVAGFDSLEELQAVVEPEPTTIADADKKADTDTKDAQNANPDTTTEPGQPTVAPGAGVQDGKPGKVRGNAGGVRGSNAKPASGNAGRGPNENAGTDYVPAPEGLTRTGSWFETAKRNIDLIELAIKIDSEKRPATPQEQEQLAKYVGFGASAIRNDLFPIPNDYAKRQEPNRLIWPNLVRDARWKPLAERIDALPREWQQSILQSSQYAHYTSEGIIRSVWGALDRMGFKGGNVFEPGMGIGSFAMLMPNDVRADSRYTGIEFDAPTALIAGLLSPQQNMIHGDFIQRKFPKNFFDVNVGNPPFAPTKIYGDPDYAKNGFFLHDFFFAKGIDLVRPGGIQVFVTSKGTMDKQSDKARKYLSERADLLGAIRLPSTAFEGNAGTSVVTDVIFLKKRAPGAAPGGHPWAKVATVETPDGPVVVNEYFAANPRMVLGQQRISGNVDDEGRRINSNGQGGEKYTVVSYDKTPAELDAKFAAAVKSLPAGAYSPPTESQAKAKPKAVDFDPAIKREGVIYLGKDGSLMRVDEGIGKNLAGMVNLSEKEQAWFKSYVGLRDKVQAARFDQLNDGPWEKSLASLNKAYDSFRKEHGPIKDFRVMVRKSTDEDGKIIGTESRIFKNRKLYREDYDNALITSLEEITEDGDIVKAPFLKGRTIGKPVERVVRSIGDALAVSLDEIGSLSLDDVGQRLGLSREEAIEALGAQVYQAPSGEWQLADEYLSGDVVAKLEEAEQAAQLQPELRRNVDALKAVQPEKLGPSQISAKLGASWIPESHVNEFAVEIGAGAVTFDPRTETWQVDGGNLRSQRNAGAEYGTAARSPSEILEAVLNSRSIKVTQTVDKKTVTDEAATTAANEMAKKIKDKFKGWVWTDTDRSTELVERYNKQYNNIAPRRFDGSHLTLPGVSLRFKLHPHQLRAIWRMVQTGNTYLAHAVGAGKTIEMIAGGMEQKRLGLIKKPIYVVPNHMLEQFSNEFMELYPMANIMVADDENFSPERRKAFVAAATLNNPDAIVITHDAFQRIGVKEESVAPIRDEILADLEIELSETAKSNDARVRRGQLEQQIEAVKQRFDRIIGAGAKDSTVKFEDMGVDFVFADEAHVFRKLDFHTAQQIKGIDPNGSKRALDMYVKTRILDGRNPGRSMVFASGTPVTNTMGELYTIMRFFAGEALDKAGISTFDAWARQFGEVAPALEPNAAGKYELIERFAKFDNVPELMSRVRQFMDVLTSDNLGALVKRPDIKGGKPNLNITAPNKALQEYMKGELARRIEISKAWKPSKDQPSNPDPIVAIITDGRFAALDPRFFGGKLEEGETSLLMDMGKGVVESYHATKDIVYKDKAGNDEPIKGSTQLVFYNLGFGEQSQKNRGFNSRAAFTKILTDGGIPRGEIYWFDDANTDAKKEAVFKDVRNGKVKVLIGSAKKMGTGVNVQKRLAVLHYQDPPWFPADVEQPHGRIIRQGNQNAEGAIEWYTTKGTYQSTMWQMVGRKQRFIDQAFTGDKNLRSMDDLGEASLFEQAAAVASGDPRAIQLAGLRQDVERFERLQASHASEQINVASSLRSAQWGVDSAKKRIATYTKAFATIGERYFAFSEGKVGNATYTKPGEFGQAIKDAFNKTAADAVMAEKPVKDKPIAAIGDAITIYMDEGVSEGKGDGKFELSVSFGGMNLGMGVSSGMGADVDATGLARRIFNQINSVDQDLRKAKEDLVRNEVDMNKLRKKLGAPFEYQQEMAEKYAELKRLEAELKAEGQAPAAPAKSAITIDDALAPVPEGGSTSRAQTGSPEANTAALYSSADSTLPAKPLTLDRVNQLVQEALSGIRGAPPVEVTARPGDIGLQVPAGSVGYGVTLRSGDIYVFQSAMGSDLDVFKTVFHELFHRGVRVLVPKAQYVQTMLDLAKGDSRIQQLAIEWKNTEMGQKQKDNLRQQGYTGAELTGQYEALAVEEALAAVAEEIKAQGKLGSKPKSMTIRFLANWLAKVADLAGMKKLAQGIRTMTYNEAERFVMSAISRSGEPVQAGRTDNMSAKRATPGTDQTQTEAFKRWFGDSAVVDADGKPLVVYHGTHSSFTEFKPNDALGGGMFFSPSPEEAGAFTGATGSNIMPVYLSAQKVWPKIVRSYDEVKAIRAAKSKGYDAIRVRDDQNGVVNWVVFDPTQVKSAIGNSGAFDPDTADIRFRSADTAGVAARMGDAIKSVTATNIKQRAGFKLTDYLGLGLQALGRRQIVDIYGDMLPLAEYNTLVTQMEADKNEGGAEADQLVTRWAKLDDEGKLADLMHDATLAQIDPAKPYVGGDDKAKYAMLAGRFNALSQEAKQVYTDTRDAYQAHHAKVRSAIKERIERSELKGPRKAELLKQMDDEFFKAVKGVYFPLARFGQYAVTVKGPDGKVESVSRAETKAEAEALRNNLLSAFPRDKGFTVGRVMLSKDFIADRDAVGRGFMTELYQVLDKQDMDAVQRAELEDTLGQLYLSSLPDLSWAKHGIHRKGTPGFSQDARRAYAQNMFHGARYLAKLRYSDLMQDELTAMQKHVDDWREVEDFDQNSAQRVVDEMNKRHESLMNPKSNPLSTALTSFGFVFHLGLSPASAMVNLSQTALVAYPIMGAKWGFGKASAALLKASAEATKGKNDITGSLNADERAAYDEAVRAGTIDVTMAHDLAGIAQGEDAGVMWKIRPVMRWASFLFHHAERFNRQVTFVASYRLAREAGADQKAAFEQATKATYDGHFDYGAANRPRVMQGNVAKVLLLFKQYGQNMVYTLARNAQQAIKGESPEVRAQARKALGGLLATHAAAAGVLGLPMVTTLLAAASMIGGDDDEPWDAKVALQNMLADTFGQKPAEVLAHGLSRLTPWDISGRVGLDRLIFPDVQEGLEGQRLAESAMAAALGPVAGIGVNVLKGAQHIGEGRYALGLEAMMPAVLRGPVKAIRYANEGVQDKSGISILDEVGPAAVAGQALGFSPSQARNAQEGKSAVMAHDRALGERRQELLTRAARASMTKDAEALDDARKEIARFNEKNPGRRINPNHIMQSVRNRQKRIDQSQDGVYLPKNRRDAMEAGRFALGD